MASHELMPQNNEANLSTPHNMLQLLGKTGLCLALMIGSETAVAPPAFADAPQAVVGMPFSGEWAYDSLVYPDSNGNYSDATSSHPSVHHRYYGDWATDLYAPATTDVKLQVTSPNGPRYLYL